MVLSDRHIASAIWDFLLVSCWREQEDNGLVILELVPR